jgi:hypothetical protein
VAFFDWEHRLKDFKAGVDADQAERQAWSDSIASYESGLEDERMSGEVDDEIEEQGNSWIQRQDILETLSGQVAEEIERRKLIQGGSYPFEIVSNSLVYKKSTTGVYEFCLAAAFNPTGNAQPDVSVSAMFEYVARDALKGFFGPNTEAFRVGWPAYSFESRGSRPKEFIEALHARCHEFKWNPREDHPIDPDPKFLKDIGLDVVAWKPWPDKRLAQFFALAQCACGKSDLDGKSLDICIERLNLWLRPVSHAKPVKCFFAAHHIPNDIHLYDFSGTAGIVFDRARISALAEANAVIFMDSGFDYHSMANFASS